MALIITREFEQPNGKPPIVGILQVLEYVELAEARQTVQKWQSFLMDNSKNPGHVRLRTGDSYRFNKCVQVNNTDRNIAATQYV
jgi:hypothetical protein